MEQISLGKVMESGFCLSELINVRRFTVFPVFFWHLCSGEDGRQELEEYQESSREVEAELETQLKQAEQQVRELRTAHHRLHMEHTNLKVTSRLPVYNDWRALKGRGNVKNLWQHVPGTWISRNAHNLCNWRVNQFLEWRPQVELEHVNRCIMVMIAVAGQIWVLEPGAPQPRHGAGGSGQGTPGAARRSVAADPAAGTDQRRPGTSQQVNNCHAQDLLVCQDASSAVFSRAPEKNQLSAC